MAPRSRLTRTSETTTRSVAHPGRNGDAAGLGLQSTIGNRATVALLSAGQAKLVVGGATDHFELEADSVADRVTSQLASPAVAREESEGDEIEEDEGPIGRMISRLQRKAAPPIGSEGGDVDAETESTINAARGSGRPLPGKLRNSFESAFGAGFESVRVHRGEQSAALNRQVGAQAFTVGSDIFLGESAPEADSDKGKHLLAHELTHTIQQGASRPHH